jgi:spore coat-associated protein N
MKKILGLSIVAVIIIATVGVGTFALFSDTETSSANTFVAGTLDLKTGSTDGVTGTLGSSSMIPGDSIPSDSPAALTLNNTGTLDASSMDISCSYIESDGSAATEFDTNMDADDTAAMMTIITLNYGTTNLLNEISDNNGNGVIDLEDFNNDAITGLDGIAAGGSADFEIQIEFNEDAGNDFQNDGIDVTFTFALNQ